MADKNIKNFLPSVFRTTKIKNFMDSTSETLFSENNSENKLFYVGRRVGGLYSPLKDYYAEEISKIREDYQLEPSLVVRDKDTNTVEDVLFYEDLIRSLSNDGVQVQDHGKMFESVRYSYAPPIDMDMFVNYSDYYWYPEGGFAIEVSANPSDIEGKLSATVPVTETGESLALSSGMHITLNDGKTYIVEGVGTSIKLLEFDIQNNKPFKIDRVYNTTVTSDDYIERFPAEYITMERGAVDENPWSRNNSWYHKDVINKIIGQTRFLADRSRRAQRPIICFSRNIELFNYGKHLDYVRSIDSGLDVNHGGIIVQAGDKVVTYNAPSVYEYDGQNFNIISTAQHGDKVTVFDGDNKADEFKWDSIENTWVMCQRKLDVNQPLLFNIYDSNDENAVLLSDEFKYPNSTFNGCEIFRYGTTDTSIEDPVLGFGLKYKAFKESSDIVFENAMNDVCTYQDGDQTKVIETGFFKINNPDLIERDNIIKFTIGKNKVTGEPVVFINGERQDSFIVKADTQYRLDITDSSTTNRGWTEQYSPIQILDEAGNEVLRPTHADSARNDVLISFDETVSGGYTFKTDYYEGKIHAVSETVSDASFSNGWEKSKSTGVELKLETLVNNNNDLFVELSYTPTSDDDIKVFYNGDTISSDDFYFDVNGVSISISGEVQEGDFCEIYYKTYDDVVDGTPEIQVIHPSINNNPYNEDINDFAFSEVFDHFRSIIRNQPFLVGTALTDNNYRDTIKDLSRGESIMKHEAPMVPLMFAHLSDQTNIIESIIAAHDNYANFKNSLIVNAEEFIKNNNVDNSNVRDVFDDIIEVINSGKRKTDAYAYSYMFATYNKYTNITFDENGIASEYVNRELDNNELYIYTNTGLKLVDIDYTIESDESTLETTLTPITFQLSDIVEVRYYQDMEPSFCAPTPMKFGLDRPKEPEIILDDTYSEDRYFIVGHDGSKTLAYSSNEDIQNNMLDGRDLILLEFEKRVYNGIRPEFKDERNRIININDVTPSNYKTLSASKAFIEDVEFKYFAKWCSDNNIDYTKNTTFNNDKVNTYNYPEFTTSSGINISGHWKSIFTYYYGTVTPHKTPWEMLEFRIKPSWWESEYGTDYSSNNTTMWSDIEQGIVRQGNRSNIMFDEYLSSNNRLRKDGLMSILPVDSNGELRSVIDIGLVPSDLNYYSIKRDWAFGEYGPTELAWRNTSEYAFVRQILYYVLKPLNYVTQAWDTTYSFNIPVGEVHKPGEMGIHSFVENSTEFNYTPGLTQWIYSFLQSKNMSGESLMRDLFYDSNVQLSHKVGGFIDAANLSVSTETFNPRSDSNITNIPSEDMEVLLHESKDISSETYSAVLVERVDADRTFFNFEEGSIYDKNEVVYNTNDKNYYRLVKDHNEYPAWESFLIYVEGRVVRYANKLYVCNEDHRSTDQEFPSNSSKWSLRGFVQNDWALLTKKPDAKTTYFKVYGYDIYDSGFKIIPASDTSSEIDITVPTIDSKQVPVLDWEPNKQFYAGQYIRLNGSSLFECRKDHISSEVFDNNLWRRSDKLPFSNMATVSVKVDGANNKIQTVPYGTIFKTTTEVSNFLMGYERYLESRGWQFDSFDQDRNKFKNWKLSVEEFIRWAYENKSTGSVIGLSPISEDIKFRAKHGVASITRNSVNTPVTLLDPKGNIIDPMTATFDRTGGVYKVQVDNPVYYCRLTIKEYEHVLTVNNTTVFNDVIYNPELGIRKDRLRVKSIKTKNWNGTLKGDGFIILGNKLLANYDTSIADIKTIGDTYTLSVNDVYNRLKYHNYGYEQRSYLEGLSMDDKAQIAFYEGFVRQKGTSEAFQRLLRSSELDVSDNMKINEEWAFKEGTFGSTDTDKMIELKFDKTDMRSTPQPVYLEYQREFDNKKATDVYIDVNDAEKWITKSTLLENNKLFVEAPLSAVKKLPSAGYVRWSDADFRSFSISGMNHAIDVSNRTVENGDRIWIAKDTSEEYGWNVYHSSDINFQVDEIITLGKSGVSSAVLRLSGAGIDTSYRYGLYNDLYNFSFYIKKVNPNDNIYILLSHDDTEYVVFENDEDVADLNQYTFKRWLPSRVNRFYDSFYEDVQDTIDTFITNNTIVPEDGFRLYVDNINAPISYRSTIQVDGFREYWSFDTYNNGEFIGINGTSMIPEDQSNVSNDVSGVYNSLGVSASDSFDGIDWPQAVWADMGAINTNEKSLEFWVRHDGDLVFENEDSYSYTFGALVAVNETTGDVMTTKLGVYPQTITEQPEYRLMHIVNGVLEYSKPIPIESGFNHAILNTVMNASGIDIEVIINGSVIDSVSSIASIGYDSGYKLYVVGIDTAEPSSDMPTIDEMALYDNTLTLLQAQNHYNSGINGVFNASESTKWGVFEYNSGLWELVYQEESVIDLRLVSEALIYNTEDKSYISNLMLHDPIKGYFAGANIEDIDYITEYDPAKYNNNSNVFSTWGSSKVGTVWWNTSTMRYIEYENGSEEERINLWGTLFPDSKIDIYEWIESDVLPQEFVDDTALVGIPFSVNDYVTEEFYNEETNEVTYKYYFWVKETNTVPSNVKRSASVVSISNGIRYPENNGVNYINFISNECVLLHDISNVMVQNDFILQIKYSSFNDDIDTHTQWTLISEDEREKDIPAFLMNKMVDSILGFTDADDISQASIVPDPTLSDNRKYGTLNSPLQSWFINVKEARRNFYEVINESLAGLNVWDIDLFWEELEEDVLRDTKFYGLVDWYKEGYDPLTIVSNLVNNRTDIMTAQLSDGEYIKVNESEGRMPSVYESGFTIYRYIKDINSYEKVGQSRSALQLKEAFYKDDITFEDSVEIRKIINLIFNVFVDSARPEFINKIFFSMVRYVLAEQPTNDWVFPTTYINVNQESRNLIKKRIYQDDKEEEIVDYITEAKPFHTKLREVKKIATGDIEYNGFYVTDFDKPPFITEERTVVNIQEELIDTIPYKQDLYYNLSIRNAKPVEYWPMNVKYSPSTIDGSFGTNFYNRDGDFIARPSGICFNNGFQLLHEFTTERDINIASSKFTVEAWLNGYSDAAGVDILGSIQRFEVLTIDVKNSNDINDKVKYHVVMYNVDGVIEYRIEAYRDGIPYLDEVIDLNRAQGSIVDNTIDYCGSRNPNATTGIEMNYLVFGIDNSSVNTKLNLSINRSDYVTYDLGNFINVNEFYDVSITFGSPDVHYFYDEFALYDRPLAIEVVRQHYDFASQSVPQRVFTLENVHDMNTVNVFIEGSILPKDKYSIFNNELRLVDEPPRAYRHVSNVVVKSKNIPDDRILSEYDQARGYYGISKTNLSEWVKTVNQKRTHLFYDRVSVSPTMSLEILLQRYETVRASETPLASFTDQSTKFSGFSGQKFTETDRIATSMYYEQLKEVVDESYTETVNAPIKKNFATLDSFTEDNIVVLVDEQVVQPRDYNVSIDGNGILQVSMLFNVTKNSTFTVRPKDKYEKLMFDIMHHRGVGVPYKNLTEIREIGFNVTDTSTPIRVDNEGELVVDSAYQDILSESGHSASVEVIYSEFDEVTADIKNADKFLRNAEEAIPEEKTELSLKEAIVFTFKNNLNIVPRGYDTGENLDIFDSISFTASAGQTTHPVTLNVPEEQILVLVNEDEWMLKTDVALDAETSINTSGNTYSAPMYSFENGDIVFNRPLRQGDKVIVTDRFAAYDQYQGSQLYIHKNIQAGGYDGNMVLPDYLNDKEDVREFIVYPQNGKVHVFECPEASAISVDEEIIYSDTTITLAGQVTEDMKLANHDQGKLAVIYATIKPEYKESQEYADLEMKPVDTKLEFIHYEHADGNTISAITRGLFGKNAKVFCSNKYNIKVYPLTIDDSLVSFTITEPYVGIKGKNAYPKYGHIMSGKD